MASVVHWKCRTAFSQKQALYLLLVLGLIVFTGYVFVGIFTDTTYRNGHGGGRWRMGKESKEVLFHEVDDVFAMQNGPSWDQSTCSPPIDVDSGRDTRHIQLHIRCDDNKSTLLTTYQQNAEIPWINFGDPCLRKALQNSCAGGAYRVPNIVHYVWFEIKTMSFYHFLSFLSVYRFQSPCAILIHGDVPEGPYWEYLVRHVPRILHVAMDPPTAIGNHTLGSIEHKSDLVRVIVLKEYGGIYLDLDSILLRSLESLRNHAVTMSLEYWSNLSNGLILSERNAIFTRTWLASFQAYRYDPKNYWELSLFVPTKIAKQHPDWIHIENMTFCTPDGEHRKQIFEGNYDWGGNFAMHLYIRYYTKQHNFVDIRRLNTTLGAVARHVIYGTRNMCRD